MCTARSTANASATGEIPRELTVTTKVTTTATTRRLSAIDGTNACKDRRVVRMKSDPFRQEQGETWCTCNRQLQCSKQTAPGGVAFSHSDMSRPTIKAESKQTLRC